MAVWALVTAVRPPRPVVEDAPVRGRAATAVVTLTGVVPPPDTRRGQVIGPRPVPIPVGGGADGPVTPLKPTVTATPVTPLAVVEVPFLATRLGGETGGLGHVGRPPTLLGVPLAVAFPSTAADRAVPVLGRLDLLGLSPPTRRHSSLAWLPCFGR